MPRRTILVVDDSPFARAAIELALRATEFDGVTLDSGEGALTQLPQLQPVALLLDVTLPGLDGLTVCRRVRQNPATTQLPIILLSGSGGVQEKLAGFRAGADDYVVKDRDLHNLPHHLGLVLRLRGERESGAAPAGA